MRRFWIDKSQLKGQEFNITGPLHNHICRISQIKKGEPFELLCEGVQKYKAVLTNLSHSKATVQIVQTKPVPPLQKPYLHLALSLPHFSKMDLLIQKAVEMGVKEFHPFFSDFSYIKKASKISFKREKRWKKIIEHSLSQSGRTESFILHPACQLQDIKIPKQSLSLMAYEGETQKHLFEVFQENPKPKEIWLFIGSEGGFSHQEAKRFSLRNKAFLISFGDQILRLETACLFGLSVLKYHYHLKKVY